MLKDTDTGPTQSREVRLEAVITKGRHQIVQGRLRERVGDQGDSAAAPAGTRELGGEVEGRLSSGGNDILQTRVGDTKSDEVSMIFNNEFLRLDTASHHFETLGLTSRRLIRS